MDALKIQEQQAAFKLALSALTDPKLERVSRELDRTHKELSHQVARLTAELEAARLARRAEHAEREKLLSRLASLLDALPGGVVIVDAQGRISEANPQAAALLGEPLEGELWQDVAARGHCPVEGTMEVGGRRLSVKSTRLEENSETVVLLSDITYEHTLQDELGRKRRLTALGEMAARLAHQIRTPLSATTLYLSQLDTNLPAERRHKICTNLKDQLNHMESLVTSMLSFVKGGNTPYQQVCLEEVIADAVHACSAEIENTNALVRIESCGHEPQILGSHDDLVAVVTNLITNAIEASGSKPRIDIWSNAVSERMALVQIRDHGRGIPADAIDRIFDPFFTTRALGTGLGLAVVASTVAKHGGTIHAANLESGGAEFTILLPIHTQEVMTKKESA